MAFNSSFKVGDKVRLTSDEEIFRGIKDEYVIAEIYTDGFGSVALREVGGTGYGFQYLELVKENKND